MMTYYVGRDLNIYEQKFNFLMEHFAPKILAKTPHRKTDLSKAEVFRFIIDLLYYEIKLPNEKKRDDVKNG